MLNRNVTAMDEEEFELVHEPSSNMPDSFTISIVSSMDSDSIIDDDGGGEKRIRRGNEEEDVRFSCHNSISSLSGRILPSIPEEEENDQQEGGESSFMLGIALTKSWESMVTTLHSPISAVSGAEGYARIGNVESDSRKQDDQDDSSDIDTAAHHLRRIYTSAVDDIKNYSGYSVCRDFILGSPALVPVVHQQQSPFKRVPYRPQWKGSVSSASSATNHDRDDVSRCSRSALEACNDETEQRLENSPARSDASYLSMPRTASRHLAFPVNMKGKTDGVQDIFGKKVIITLTRRNQSRPPPVFVQELYRNRD